MLDLAVVTFPEVVITNLSLRIDQYWAGQYSLLNDCQIL